MQVLLPVRTNGLYGQRAYWPIFEAITRNDLVAGIHWGGQSEGAPSPTGYASYYAEEMAAETQVYGAQLTSMVIEGLFQKFPTVRVSMLEGGFAWMPTWAWNLNKKWKGLRREIPWVNRPPTEIIRDHIRFSTAPCRHGAARAHAADHRMARQRRHADVRQRLPASARTTTSTRFCADAGDDAGQRDGGDRAALVPAVTGRKHERPPEGSGHRRGLPPDAALLGRGVSKFLPQRWRDYLGRYGLGQGADD